MVVVVVVVVAVIVTVVVLYSTVMTWSYHHITIQCPPAVAADVSFECSCCAGRGSSRTGAPD